MANSKYQALETHLRMIGNQRIMMTFKDIEAVIGSGLPKSARKHRPWWSNNPCNSTITQFWLAAGYKTSEVDLDKQQVVFVQQEKARFDVVSTQESRTESSEHPVLGCMADTVTVPDGVDLTKPAMPEWSHLARTSKVFHD